MPDYLILPILHEGAFKYGCLCTLSHFPTWPSRWNEKGLGKVYYVRKLNGYADPCRMVVKPWVANQANCVEGFITSSGVVLGSWHLQNWYIPFNHFFLQGPPGRRPARRGRRRKSRWESVPRRNGIHRGNRIQSKPGISQKLFISPLFSLCSGVRPSARPETTRIRGPSIDPGSSPLVIFFPHRWVDDNVK